LAKSANVSKRRALSLSFDEVFQVLSALSECIEEDAWRFEASDLKALCSLHCRFFAAVGFTPDYSFEHGLVITVLGGRVIAVAVPLGEACYVGSK